MSEGKLNIRATMYLSFGFMAVSLAWSLYNSMVPQILDSFGLSAGMIGLVMVFDNIAGVVLEPTFGHISDRTRTRFGRRMPYLIAGVPIAALLFIFIPHVTSLWTLIGLLAMFCIVMAIWRTPVISLMPDLVPGPHRSQANGIVNMFGGIGSLIAFGVGGLLLNMGGFPLPFLTAALVMLLALGVLLWKVREPAQAYLPDAEKPKVKLTSAEWKSLLLILFAIFFWFVGYNAVETFFTLFAKYTLGVAGGTATIMLGVFSIAFLAFAIPAGFIGAKIGRRKTILIGLGGVTIVFIPMLLMSNLVATIVCLFVGGLFWACVNINSLPMVVRIGGDRLIGTFIGFYYLFSVSAQIASPPSVGRLIDFTGQHGFWFIPASENYRVLFLWSCVAFAIAFLVLSFVRHGEDNVAEPDQTSAVEALAAMD